MEMNWSLISEAGWEKAVRQRGTGRRYHMVEGGGDGVWNQQ